jgi:nitrite reductase (NADH) small subunit
MSTTETWTPVCPLEDLEVERGVAALVNGQAVAIFRTHDDAVFGLANQDPFSRASVLSRGIVGTRAVEGEEVPFVASPMHKQAFDLRTGQCLDDPQVAVASYDVRVVDGVVMVGPRRGS